MSYHISDHGHRLEAELENLIQAVKALRSAGAADVGHETLNEIGQAINRVGCVLHNIGSTIPQLDVGDIATIEWAIIRMPEATACASDNYKILVERAVSHYVVKLQIRQGELTVERDRIDEGAALPVK